MIFRHATEVWLLPAVAVGALRAGWHCPRSQLWWHTSGPGGCGQLGLWHLGLGHHHRLCWWHHHCHHPHRHHCHPGQVLPGAGQPEGHQVPAVWLPAVQHCSHEGGRWHADHHLSPALPQSPDLCWDRQVPRGLPRARGRGADLLHGAGAWPAATPTATPTGGWSWPDSVQQLRICQLWPEHFQHRMLNPSQVK